MSPSTSTVNGGSSPFKAPKPPRKRSVRNKSVAPELDITSETIISPAVAAGATIPVATAATAPVLTTDRSLHPKKTHNKLEQGEKMFGTLHNPDSEAEAETPGASSSKPAPRADPNPGSASLGVASTLELRHESATELKSSSDFVDPIVYPSDVTKIPHPWAIGRYWRPGATGYETFYLGNKDGNRFQNQADFDEGIWTFGRAEDGEDVSKNHFGVPAALGIISKHFQVYPGFSDHFAVQIAVQTNPDPLAKHSIDSEDESTDASRHGAHTFLFDGALRLDLGDDECEHTFIIYPAGVDEIVKDHFITQRTVTREDGLTFVGEPKVSSKNIRPPPELRRVVFKIKSKKADIQEIKILQDIDAMDAHPGKRHIIMLFANNSHDRDRRQTILSLEYHKANLKTRMSDPLWIQADVAKEAAVQVFSAVDFLHINLIVHSDIGLEDFETTAAPINSKGFRIRLTNLGQARKLKSSSSLLKEDVKAVAECFVELLEYHQGEEPNKARNPRKLDLFCQNLSKVVQSTEKDQGALAKLLKMMLLPDSTNRIDMNTARFDKWFELEGRSVFSTLPKKQIHVRFVEEQQPPRTEEPVADDTETAPDPAASSSKTVAPLSPTTPQASFKRKAIPSRKASVSPKKRKSAKGDEDHKPPSE